MISVPHALEEFPRALSSYPDHGGHSITAILSERLRIEPFNGIATGIFLLAILHTFAAARFTAWSHCDSAPPR